MFKRLFAYLRTSEKDPALVQELGTKYVDNFILARETELPEMQFEGVAIPTNVRRMFLQNFTNQELFWTNDDAHSLYKIGYSDRTQVNCNWLDADGESRDAEPSYRAYNCMLESKMVYLLPPMPDPPVDFNVDTVYSPVPYHYEYFVTLFGRRMNSFNMCFSPALYRRLEQSVVRWANQKSGIWLENMNRTQLYTPRQLGGRSHHIKLQMCVLPEYYFWVMETLLHNKTALDPLGLVCIKFAHLIGEQKLNSLSDVYPDLVEGEDVRTYSYEGREYKREVLNQPNVVFYLFANANIRGMADTLCRLFPNDYRLSFGVPRFNTRLNDNVYISFSGDNRDKYNLEGLHVPDEYRIILANPAFRDLSIRFSGHTLLNAEGENNILSYQKLLPMGSFRTMYTQYELEPYYDEIFSDPIFAVRPREAGSRRKRRRTRKKI